MKFAPIHTNPKKFKSSEYAGDFWDGVLWGQCNLNLWTKTRSGLTLPDSRGGTAINILTPVYKAYGGWYVASTGGSLERFFNGTDYTVYFKVKQIASYTGTAWIAEWGNLTGLSRGVSLVSIWDDLYTTFADGTNKTQTIQLPSVNTNMLSAGWIEVFIQIDFTAKRVRCNLYKQSDGSSLGTAINADITGWDFTDVDNWDVLKLHAENTCYCDLKKFTGLKTIAQCRNNAYVTDCQFFIPDLITGTDVVGTHHFNINNLDLQNVYYDSISTYMLDYGYSLYRSINKAEHFYEGWDVTTFGYAYADKYVPNTPSGVAVARTILDYNGNTYVKVEDHAGSLTQHNLADSLLNIPGLSWDKSNTTIYKDSVRTANPYYYDSGNSNRWHISELDYLTFSEKCNVSYKGINFFKITDNSVTDRKFLTEVFSYSTNKTANDLIKILQYTGDYDEINSAIKVKAKGLNPLNLLLLAGISGAETINVHWGDGTKTDYIAMNQIDQGLIKKYPDTAEYDTYIFKPENLYAIRFSRIDQTANYFVPAGSNINEFHKAVNAKIFQTCDNWDGSPWVGDIGGFSSSMEEIYMRGSPYGVVGGIVTNTDVLNLVSGSVTKYKSLKRIFIYGQNTIYGDMTGCIDLIDCYLSGLNRITADVSTWTKIKQIEGDGYNGLYGSITNCADFEYICLSGINRIGGDVTGKTKITYLSGGYNLFGDISGLINLWYFQPYGGLCSGSIVNLTKLAIFSASGTISKPPDLLNNKQLQMFIAGNWVLSSAEINKYLADFWTMKDEVKLNDSTYRYIDLIAAVGSGSPTGQGLIDKANLQAYRTPTPPGTSALWVVYSR